MLLSFALNLEGEPVEEDVEVDHDDEVGYVLGEIEVNQLV
jgi:hypothetical protein